MALHTKKDFATLCGLKTKDLSVYIKRKKVIVEGDFIDDKNNFNADFLLKFSSREKKIVEIVTEPVKIVLPVVEITEKNEKKPAKSRDKLSAYELEREQKIWEIEKKEVDTRIALLKEAKMMGDSIPVDLVKGVVSQLSKAMISSFKDGADNFLIEISKRKGLSGTETAELHGALINIINQSSTNAIIESKKSIKSIVNEYSTKREVGEHD